MRRAGCFATKTRLGATPLFGMTVWEFHFPFWAAHSTGSKVVGVLKRLIRAGFLTFREHYTSDCPLRMGVRTPAF